MPEAVSAMTLPAIVFWNFNHFLVVEGFARARQEMQGDYGPKRVVPVLIHGDAAFAGQGIVACASSTRPRLQAGSQGRSQVRPRIPGKTFDFQLTR